MSIEQRILIGALAISTSIVFYTLYYYLQGAWQLLAMAGGNAGALAALGLSLRAQRRRRPRAAAWLLLLGLLTVPGLLPLLIPGHTLFAIASAGLLVLTVGVGVLPRRWRTLLCTVAIFGCYAWLIEWLAPLPRLAHSRAGLTHTYLLGTSTAFLALILWHSALVALRSFTSIRARLFVTSLLLVLFTGGALTYFLTIVLMYQQQNDAIARLSAVATRKQGQIDHWTETMRAAVVMFAHHTRPQLDVLLDPRARGSAEYQAALKHINEDIQESSGQARVYSNLYVIDTRGELIASLTGAHDNLPPLDSACLQVAKGEACLQPPRYYPALDRWLIVAALPVAGRDGRPAGVVAGYAGLGQLDAIAADGDGLGSTGTTYLVDANSALLTPSPGRTATNSHGAALALATRSSGSALYHDGAGTPVVGVYRWLPDLQSALLTEQTEAEAYQLFTAVFNVYLVVTLLLLVAAALTALSLIRSITAPLNGLALAAHQIASGTLDVTADVQQDDEIGALARAFNQMTGQLRQALEQLEQRVQQRTQELVRANHELQAENSVRRQAENELLQRNYELGILSRRLVEIQESERQYIARELHDESGQALTSLMLRLDMLEHDAQRGLSVADRVAELKGTVEEVLSDLHALAIELRPASLDHVGLVPALRQYAARLTDRHGLVIDFGALGLDGARLPPAMETTIYRIVQEALANVIRHAQASHADVLIERRHGCVRLIVEDNGLGFDTTAAMYSGRLGLLGMRERVEMLGGRLEIDSAPGSGTTIVMEAPYDGADPDRG